MSACVGKVNNVVAGNRHHRVVEAFCKVIYEHSGAIVTVDHSRGKLGTLGTEVQTGKNAAHTLVCITGDDLAAILGGELLDLAEIGGGQLKSVSGITNIKRELGRKGNALFGKGIGIKLTVYCKVTAGNYLFLGNVEVFKCVRSCFGESLCDA